MKRNFVSDGDTLMIGPLFDLTSGIVDLRSDDYQIPDAPRSGVESREVLEARQLACFHDIDLRSDDDQVPDAAPPWVDESREVLEARQLAGFHDIDPHDPLRRRQVSARPPTYRVVQKTAQTYICHIDAAV